MNKYWKYNLFPKFLNDVKDCTYQGYEAEDLYDLLNQLVISALNDFMFPKVSLAYENDNKLDPLDNSSYGYYFTDNNIGEAEYKVIVAYMKVHWVSAQITWDTNFKNPFFDKDIKGFSPANMLTAMSKTLELYTAEAKQISFNYNRVRKDGKISWGEINNADK